MDESVEKSAVYEARRFDGEPDAELELWLGDRFETWLPSSQRLAIHTVEAHEQIADAGDWIVKGAEGLHLLRGEQRLRTAVTEFLTIEDTHVEGRVINDGYYEGPICADCERYWPCPVEELRRAARSEGV